MILNEKDYKRITASIQMHTSQGAKIPNLSQLISQINKAKIIPSTHTPVNLVTMNSRVLLTNFNTKQNLEITLVYHPEADVKQKKISLFAPIGTSLIGKKVNEIFECILPNGSNACYQIKELLYQPESAGDKGL